MNLMPNAKRQPKTIAATPPTNGEAQDLIDAVKDAIDSLVERGMTSQQIKIALEGVATYAIRQLAECSGPGAAPERFNAGPR